MYGLDENYINIFVCIYSSEFPDKSSWQAYDKARFNWNKNICWKRY